MTSSEPVFHVHSIYRSLKNVSRCFFLSPRGLNQPIESIIFPPVRTDLNDIYPLFFSRLFSHRSTSPLDRSGRFDLRMCVSLSRKRMKKKRRHPLVQETREREVRRKSVIEIVLNLVQVRSRRKIEKKVIDTFFSVALFFFFRLSNDVHD